MKNITPKANIEIDIIDRTQPAIAALELCLIFVPLTKAIIPKINPTKEKIQEKTLTIEIIPNISTTEEASSLVVFFTHLSSS